MLVCQKERKHIKNAGWGLNPGFESVCRELSFWLSVSKCIKSEWSLTNLFPFNMWLAEKASLCESWHSMGRDLRRREWYQCRPHLVVMRWFVCMPAGSLDGLSMWAYLCENQSAAVCVFVVVQEGQGGYSELGSVGVCEISPGWGACVSDVNSALSARFSTLPAAVKRARPSLPPPPPRGLISFFILSAIQLDFLRGHRG